MIRGGSLQPFLRIVEGEIYMLEIKENQELNVVNVLSYRGKVRQAEIERIVNILVR